MAQLLLQTIEQIGREKNIEPAIIVEAIEEAMAVAAQKFYRTEDYLEAKLDPATGEVLLHAVKRVVEEVEDPLSEISLEDARAGDAPDAEVGDELRKQMQTDQLGRIAAQAAKQVIFQKVRDAEHDNVYNEYIERVGELVTGIVKRFERGEMVVDLGRAEALLPRREQSRAEHYNIGDRVRVVIVDVLRETRGPQIIVSRSSPDLLKRLFEMEVPEIYDETVLIKAAVREGGDRAKVAVLSVEPDVDAVGACVGMRGSRVQSIIRELRGEKIDIVEWADEEHQFAINALKPARVNRVSQTTKTTELGGTETHLEVIVNEDQLSLAIGKKGQNVRLAGKLIGRKIDVKSEEQKRDELAEAAVVDATAALTASPGQEIGLEDLPGVGPKAAAALHAAGLDSVAALAAAELATILGVPGIGPKSAQRILDAAQASVPVAPARSASSSSEVAAEVAAEVTDEAAPDTEDSDDDADDASETPAPETAITPLETATATDAADTDSGAQ